MSDSCMLSVKLPRVSAASGIAPGAAAVRVASACPGIDNIASHLALTQQRFLRSKTCLPSLFSPISCTRAPAPHLPGESAAVMAPARAGIDHVAPVARALVAALERNP